MTTLGPQFHGTGADLHPGDRVLPAEVAGVRSNWGEMHTVDDIPVSKVAFSTTSEKSAWNFATTATGWRGKRASVLRVAPHPEQREGLFHRDGPGGIPGEMVAPHFDVQERIDVMPGRQGTLPINWKQFAPRGPTEPIPSEIMYNHPKDEDPRQDIVDRHLQENYGRLMAEDVKSGIAKDQPELPGMEYWR